MPYQIPFFILFHFALAATQPGQRTGQDVCVWLFNNVVLAHLVIWSAITTETCSTCTFTKTYGVSGLFLGSHRCVGCVGFVSKCRPHVWALTTLLFQNCVVGFVCYATRESIDVVESFLCNTLHIKTWTSSPRAIEP